MEVYVASMTTVGTVEAEQDDPSADAEQMASPAFTRVFAQFGAAEVAAVKRDLEDDLRDEMGEDHEDEEFIWTDTGWMPSRFPEGRPVRRLTASTADGEPMGWVIVHRAEVE